MGRIFLQVKGNASQHSLEQPPYFLLQPNPPSSPSFRSDGFNLNDKVSPSILLIIIIMAIVFFVSGLLHLLVRFLWRPSSREADDLDNVTALQGQLQQLFHLHDAGVDQSFIDTLPVFNYKAIIGLKNPFDCAVCLCEFEPEDTLRLLPKCSHAFHMECIDTWLLSHSTCPLCRANLLPDFSSNNGCSPIVLVLESGSESSREIIPEREAAIERSSSVIRANSHLGCRGDNEFGSTRVDLARKSGDLSSNENTDPIIAEDSMEKVVTVKLGKFRSVDGGESSSNNNADARRCFSMGSFAYIMDENSSLQVPIRIPVKKQPIKKPALPLTPGRRLAMSECDCESRRDFKFAAFDGSRSVDVYGIGSSGNGSGAAIGSSRKESFSISKIWLRGKKDKPNAVAEGSRRTVSFRFPARGNVVSTDDFKSKNEKFDTRSAISEMDIGKWENGASEYGYDEENQSCHSMDSQARAPSFARRTLLWLTGRQNKVIHSSSASNS
ncbi:hypothetical protein L6164_014119 [Bauhinia variegata]|uniref:Uncharacterized protein n=1 Tax=Bauhinia variegata TaxID=167791 RepID=A0ACB9NH79_BAUVA|nr:hypothetical protein L6164_014119 [Bauhinia variegata]